GADARVLLWRVDGTLVHTLQMLTQVLAVAWSPDGAQLIIGAGNTVTFVEAQQATVLGSYTRHTAPVTALGWTHAAVPLALSASEDKRALVWQGQTHQVQASFARHTTPILALATLTDIVATASLGGVVRIWSAITGQEVHGYWSDTAQAYQSLVFSPSGLLAVGGKDGMIRLWAQGSTCRLQQRDIFGLRCLDLPQRWQGHTGPIRAAAFSSDGDLLATGGDDHQLLLWSKMHQMPLLRHTMSEPITALSWSPTAPYLAVAARSQVTIYQISTEEEG
ncbi:MAG: hypothetical protein J2P37_25570, partial [Ktedonobacteraceae bacterium]|nr:hypothetical protein [Ktedonobacteraceae bacterium]